MKWLGRLFRHGRVEEQLDKELLFHIEEQAADLVARGIDHEEARRLAKLALGGTEQVKEECRDARGTRWLEDLVQDLRYAVRTLGRKPGFTVVALLTIALGVGATTVMFTVFSGVLLKPLSYPEPDRLVTLRQHMGTFGNIWGFAYPSFLDAKRDSRALALAAWTYGGGTISDPGEPEYVDGRMISAELFPVLGVTPEKGRAFLTDEDRPGGTPVVIISSALWRRIFAGDPAVVGMQIVYDGQPRTVVGVAPPGLKLGGKVDVFTPLGQNTEPRMQNRGAYFIHVLGRLAPNVTFGQLQSELALISLHRAKQYPVFDEGHDILALPLQQDLIGDVGPTLWLLLGAVSLVLLIACVNVASLLLARAVSRERELAMRVALGANRGRLVRQCLTESSVLALVGGLLGGIAAAVAVRPFVALWPGSLPRAQDVGLDWRVILFSFGISLLSGVLFGLAPALRAPVDAVEQALRAGGRSVVGSSRRLQASFVVSEVALAVVLLVAAGMLGHTLLHLSSLDPGLNVKNVLTARAAISPSALSSPGQIRAAWQDFLDRARQSAGVQSAALADIIPMRTGENSMGYSTVPNPPSSNDEPVALASCVTPDYLKVMGIPLRRGRFFDDHDLPGNRPVIVIDENLAKHAFGGEDPVGKQLWLQFMSDSPVLIIGVVGHVRHWGLAGDDLSKVQDQIYYPFSQVPDQLLHFFSSVMSVAVRTKVAPLSLVESLRTDVRGASGDQVLYDVLTMEQLVSGSLDQQRFLMVLFGVFAGVALLLACVGIYGVLAYLTNQRVPEIGVRVALGASRAGVLSLILRQSLSIVLIGIGLGAVASLAAGRAMERFVEGMQPIQISTFAITVPLLVLAALAASFIPARRASRIDPISALRQE